MCAFKNRKQDFRGILTGFLDMRKELLQGLWFPNLENSN